MTDHPNAANPHALSQAPPEFARTNPPPDLTPSLKRLLAGHTLDADEAAYAFEAMMSGEAHHGEIGALLALLATRTPTSQELLGAAQVMRRHVDRVECGTDPANLVDTAGTGGAPKTFNVSTAAAIVAAAAGAKIAKHGNKSRTGRGSAEVLRQLGVNVDADRATQAKCLDECGVCFCFAIHHHPATRHVMPVRLALGFPTIFNLLGPLTNPAGAERQVMGVYHERFLHPIAEALANLGATNAIVMHSEDGLDEFSIAAPTRVMRVRGGKVTEETIAPEDVGLQRADLSTVQATDLDHAAQMIRDVLDPAANGQITPARDMTLLASAAALLVAEVVDDWQSGVDLARKMIASGKAPQTLERLAAISGGK